MRLRIRHQVRQHSVEPALVDAGEDIAVAWLRWVSGAVLLHRDGNAGDTTSTI